MARTSGRMPARPRAARSWSSALGLLGDLARLLARLEALDHRLEALALDLRTEILAIALDVADAIDDHIPRFPALGRHAQRVVDRHLVAVLTAHLGTHRRGRGTGLDVSREDLEAVGGELDQRVTIVGQQRLFEGGDETLPLVRSRAAPVLPEHHARRSLGVEVRHEVFVD